MTNKHIITILAVGILMALFIPAVSAADPCSFCEFINISNITRGVTDHSLLTNLSADDHHQYILTDGSRAFTGKQSLGGFNVTNLLDPVGAQDAATKNYVDAVNTSMQVYVDARPSITDHGLLSNLSGDGHPQYLRVDGIRAMSGNLNMASNQIISLITGTTGDSATNKSYVDAVNTSMKSYVDTDLPYISSANSSIVLTSNGSYILGTNASYVLVDGSRPFTGDQSMGGMKLTNLITGTTGDTATNKTYVDAVNSSMKSYVDTSLLYISSVNSSIVLTSNGSYVLTNNGSYVLTNNGSYILGTNISYVLIDGSRPFTGDQSMGSKKLTNLITGTTGDTATNKTYVDTVNSSMKSYVDSVVSPDTAPGSNGQVLYNQGGAEGANASFTFNNSTGTITATFFVGDGSGLTGIGETAATALTFDVKAGEILKKGQPVYLSGASGANPIVMNADNTIASKTRVVGLITSDLATNGQGYVRRGGTLTSVDTRSTNTVLNPLGQTWNAGDLLFLEQSGGLTNVRPTSGRSVKCAYTLKGSNTQDTLLVYPFENPVWITGASAEDVVLRLGDSVGTNKVSIRNYTNSDVAYINSQGLASFNGTNELANITMNNHYITGLLSGTSGDSVVNKTYVDTFPSYNATYDAKPSSNVGYTLFGQSTTLTPARNTTYYFGMLPKVAGTTAGQNKIFIPHSGTIKWAQVYTYSGTAGTAQTWGMYVQVNGTTTFAIGVNQTNTNNERIWTNDSINIPVTAGNYIEFVSKTPGFVTQPATSIWAGTVYIE